MLVGNLNIIKWNKFDFFSYTDSFACERVKHRKPHVNF